MFKAIKRLITSGLKPHSCKLCYKCYVCHECLREKNQIRQCCYGVTEEELDILHEELKRNFSLIYPVRKHSINENTNTSHSKNDGADPEECCVNSSYPSDLLCKMCGKVFKTEFTLTRHFNAHVKAGEKFKCQTCNKCFAINRDLQRHYKIHREVENKSKVCTYCDKEFSSRHYLKIHMRRHTGEKPYKCELCNKVFTTQTILNIHYRTHVIKEQAFDDSFREESTDSESEDLEDDKVNFIEHSLDLESLVYENSNSEMSNDQDFISNLSEYFNLHDFDEDEIPQKNTGSSLSTSLDLKTSLEKNVDFQQSYKAPLVIKLKPSID